MNRLAGPHIEGSVFVLYTKHSLQNQRELVEFRALTGLFPSAGGAHAGNRDLAVPGVYQADELLDHLRFLPMGFHKGGRAYQFGHGCFMMISRSLGAP